MAKSSKKKSHHPKPDYLFEEVDPSFIEKIGPFLEGLYKYYFRVEVEGWENLPKDELIFVGNHNGLLTFEVLMLFHAWWKRFGAKRKALGLAHVIAIKNPAFKWLMPKIGAMPAHPELAAEALEKGYSLLVYPGGEKEAFRPYKDRKKIEFYGRKGFIRLALRTGKPLVPIVSCGAHETYIILHRGEEIAEALGLKDKIRLHGLPLTFRSIFFLWCVSTGMLTFFPLLLAPWAFASIFVPLPAKMTFKILPPVDVKSRMDPALSEEENVDQIYEQILSEMQSTLDEEYSKRRFPVIG